MMRERATRAPTGRGGGRAPWWDRSSVGLTRFKERLIAAGTLTGQQIAAQLGVRRTTIGNGRNEKAEKA
jgi:hypothetical protein